MSNGEFIQSLAFTAPALCALFCMVLTLFDTTRTANDKQNRRLRLFLARFYLVAALCWMGLFFYITDHRIFVYYQTVFILALMLDQVLIYHFVFIVTATTDDRKFNPLHFTIPLILTAISIAGSFNIPYEQQLAVIYKEGNGIYNQWFSALHFTTSIIFILYNTFYPILSLIRIRRYRRQVVNYSADTQHTSLTWLSVMTILTLITVPAPLAGLLLNIDIFTQVYFIWLGALPTFVVYLLLCYNLLSDNYVIISPKEEDDKPLQANTKIDRRKFEWYIHEKKPYLNPKLKITDVAADLNTNRSYISSFVNQQYGMSFSRYINRLRLKELDKLRTSPQRDTYTNIDFILGAGFGNYRSYLRVKSEENDPANQKV